MAERNLATGVTLAAIAASLFAAAPLTAVAHTDSPDGHAHGANGKCVGGNSCKGQSACKTAGSQCAGQNACEGQGFTITTAEDCDAKGGTFEAV